MTILLVDDADEVRRLVAEMLAQAGYRVIQASDGLDALNLWDSHGGDVDLLLTDVVMPHMTGGELARRVSQLRPDVPVVYMSGYSDDRLLQEVCHANFLAKPFTSSDLTDKVRRALESR